MNASMTVEQFRSLCEAAAAQATTDYYLENRGPYPDRDSPTLWLGNVWATIVVAGSEWTLNVSYYAQGGVVTSRDEWVSRESGDLPHVVDDEGGQALYQDEIKAIVGEYIPAPAPVLPDAE